MAYQMIDLRDELPWHATRRWKKRDYVERLILHTTGSENQDPFATNAYHISEKCHIAAGGCPRICYHDYVTKSGIVYHCNTYEEWTWHAGLYNKTSIGIVMAFSGQIDTERPTDPQWSATVQHLAKLCLYLHILPQGVIGHREVPGMYTLIGKGSKKFKKTCPGMSVDLDRTRTEVAMRMQRRLAADQLYTGEIDGVFGPLSRAALEKFVPISQRKLSNVP